MKIVLLSSFTWVYPKSTHMPIVISCGWPNRMVILTLRVDVFNLNERLFELHGQNYLKKRAIWNALAADEIKKDIWENLLKYHVYDMAHVDC